MIRIFIASLLLPSAALAQAAAPVTLPTGSPLMNILPFALICGVFYLFIIRPQQRQRKELATLQAGLKRGDEVVTSGGVLGKYLRDGDNGAAVIEIASGVEIRVIKATLANVIPKNASPVQTSAKKKGKADSVVKNDNVVPDKESVANDN
ncbi:MAG: preprotein translocase subunit YajC [Alphaproteobacteria bacterium]